MFQVNLLILTFNGHFKRIKLMLNESFQSAPPIPRAFLWRRAHSIAGLWLVIFLIQHLLTNSQAALFVGQDGQGFIHSVNSIHDLPYLPVIELTLLALPILIHGWWGILYLRTSKINSFPSDGTTPSLGQYPRNRAYSWQRITSWLLVFGIVAHVIQMRFWEAPAAAQKGSERFFMVKVNEDAGLSTLSARLNVKLFSAEDIVRLQKDLPPLLPTSDPLTLQQHQQQKEWIEALQKRPLAPYQRVAVAPDFGTAELLMVRETFKMPAMILLYTLFVIAACYHAFNGLWTFLISWGITQSARSQTFMRKVAISLMILVTFLGLAAVWGTYWINLKQ